MWVCDGFALSTSSWHTFTGRKRLLSYILMSNVSSLARKHECKASTFMLVQENVEAVLSKVNKNPTYLH